MTVPGFTKFPKENLGFLRALKENNNRNWFNENKDRHERAVKGPAEQFCGEMTTRLRRLTRIEHGSKIFRIHRDVRFSKDKTPYNSPVMKSEFDQSAWVSRMITNTGVLPCISAMMAMAMATSN